MALRLAQEAVELVQLAHRLPRPPLCGDDRAGLVAERLDVLRARSEMVEGVRDALEEAQASASEKDTRIATPALPVVLIDTKLLSMMRSTMASTELSREFVIDASMISWSMSVWKTASELLNVVVLVALEAYRSVNPAVTKLLHLGPPLVDHGPKEWHGLVLHLPRVTRPCSDDARATRVS